MNLKDSGIDNQLRVLLESLLVRRETPNILIELDIVLIGIGVYLHRFVVDFKRLPNIASNRYYSP